MPGAPSPDSAWRWLVLAIILVTAGGGCSRSHHAGESADKLPVRVAVVSGMTLSGMWQVLSARFTADTGWPVELVVSGPKDTLAAAFRQGKADLLTMHSSGQATDLVADGYARNLRPWARNEHAILGPAADRAGIQGGHDGAAALSRIAETCSPSVDFAGPGSRDVVHRQILAQGDPARRRPYVVVEAEPAKLSHTSMDGAKALADHMVSERGHMFLVDFAAK